MQLWTLKETAQYTRMSLAFWRKQLWLRTIPSIRVGRSVRLEADDVRAFLNARTRAGRPEVRDGR
jgi:excisionase family DNA binding protein